MVISLLCNTLQAQDVQLTPVEKQVYPGMAVSTLNTLLKQKGKDALQPTGQLTKQTEVLGREARWVFTALRGYLQWYDMEIVEKQVTEQQFDELLEAAINLKTYLTMHYGLPVRDEAFDDSFIPLQSLKAERHPIVSSSWKSDGLACTLDYRYERKLGRFLLILQLQFRKA